MARRPRPSAEQTDFVGHVVNTVAYWNELKGLSQQERLHGLAFSIMSALDGASINLPGYEVRPLAEDGKKPGPDIAGDLHDRFTQLTRPGGQLPAKKLPPAAMTPARRNGAPVRS